MIIIQFFAALRAKFGSFFIAATESRPAFAFAFWAKVAIKRLRPKRTGGSLKLTIFNPITSKI